MRKERIKNSLTGFVHNDKWVGTKDEYEFYTVMDSTRRNKIDKLFFDYAEEFIKYQQKMYPGEEYFLVNGIDGKKTALQEMQD